MTIAYIVSEYPALSHTFIRREVAELRKRGLPIETYSVRPAQIDWEGDETRSILGGSKLAVIGRAAGSIITNPIRAISTFLVSQSHRETGLKGWAWSLFHYVEALAFVSMLRGKGVSRIHSHFANNGATIGLLAAHFMQIRWSLTLHGISEIDPPAGQMLPDKLRRADFVACASWFMRAQAMRFTPVECWDKYRIVRCGVSVPEEARLASDSKRACQLVTVGRVSAEKGYPLLMRAMRQLREEGVSPNLAIVGGGPLADSLNDDIAKSGLDEAVTMLGPLPEAETLAQIAGSDAFVLPSLMEGLPVVLMEAMAAGKPVVAPTVAGIPEMIEDGVTGLLFRPGDWEHLAAKLKVVINNPKLARKLGMAGRQRILEEFAIEEAVTPLEKLFRNGLPVKGEAANQVL